MLARKRIQKARDNLILNTTSNQMMQKVARKIKKATS